ncbi:unnamed protein product [Caenorhabditis brenneri]
MSVNFLETFRTAELNPVPFSGRNRVPLTKSFTGIDFSKGLEIVRHDSLSAFSVGEQVEKTFENERSILEEAELQIKNLKRSHPDTSESELDHSPCRPFFPESDTTSFNKNKQHEKMMKERKDCLEELEKVHEDREMKKKQRDVVERTRKVKDKREEYEQLNKKVNYSKRPKNAKMININGEKVPGIVDGFIIKSYWHRKIEELCHVADRVKRTFNVDFYEVLVGNNPFGSALMDFLRGIGKSKPPKTFQDHDSSIRRFRKNLISLTSE